MSGGIEVNQVEAAYDFLRAFQPFRAWRLPSSDAIEFMVNLDTTERGHFLADDEEPRISVSAACVGRMDSLLKLVAHEMIHLYQHVRKTDTRAEHNAEFRRLARRVCALHGWDLMEFL